MGSVLRRKYYLSQVLSSTRTPYLHFLTLLGTLSHIEGKGQPVKSCQEVACVYPGSC